MKKTHSLSILLSAMATLALLISLPAAAQTPQSQRRDSSQHSVGDHKITCQANLTYNNAEHITFSNRIMLDGIPAGAYLLRLVTPQGVAARKLIVR